MSVHYKFKSALDFDTITFDGLHITVSELKKAIIFQKRLGKTTDFDLKITNAQTKEDYDDDSYLIPKNTSLIIARIPLATLPKKIWEQQSKQEHQTKGFPKVDKVVLDLSKMIGSEEEKIQAMMQQSAADYDPKGYQKVKGQPQIGEVPPNYRCNKCKKVGHWIKNCPYTGKDHIEMKRTTGIPKSFREKDDRSCEPNTTESTTLRHNGKIPDNLICSICKDIFTDAVMIPCCGSSFCDDCVRTSLLESDDNECPDCREKGSSPGSLIPNRFLRNSVNAFKNETGYKRPVKQKVAPPSEDSLLAQQLLKNDQNPSTAAVQDEIESKPADSEINTEVKSAIQSNESTSADESDYEDNITVTVPSTTSLENNTAVLQIKPNNEGNSCSIKKSEKTPRFLTQVSALTSDDNQAQFPHYLNSNWDAYNKKDENEETQIKKRKLIKPLVQSSSTSSQNPLAKETQYQLPRQEHYQQIPLHTFTSHQPLAHGHAIGYSQIPTPHCNRYPHYAQLPYSSRIGCMTMGRSETPQLPLSVNLASVYEGVAAKVGSGVIDDPLEAFNRIMREKEKNKEHQRSPIRRISRSKEKTFRKYSPQQLQRSRGPVSPYDTKPMQKSNQRQSREREKIFYRNQGPELSRNYQKRSSSLSDRNSRTHQHGNTSVNYLKRDRHENEDLYKNNLSDICPPGTSERPPPGFENSSYKREYRRNQKHKHDDYIKNRNYERYFAPEYDINKTAIHSNGKESFQTEISKKEFESSRQYSPYKSTLKHRSEEFDLNPKDYTIYDERETSQKDIKFFKDSGRKQSQKDNNMIVDECPVQNINILDVKTDNSNKHYKQQILDFNKIKSEFETVTRSDKINSDHEKKVKERKKKKKSKDEKERKRQKKDGKSERHIGRRYPSEKDSCGKLLVSENSEGNINKNKTRYRAHTPDLHRNVIPALNRESSPQKNSIFVNVIEENIKQSEENSQDGVHSSRPLTGISKWEREEENMFLLNYKENSELESLDDSRDKVNTEVLRRAEHALFSRSIGNKNSSTYQKSHIKEKSSPRPRIMKRSNSRDSNKSKDLISVKLQQLKKLEKSNEENIGSLTKSVKSRLGIKVTKNVAELDSKNVNKYRSRSRSIGRHYYCGKEDYFEPDHSKKNSYIHKNKAKYPELQDYRDDLQQMRSSVSKNLGQQRSKRTSEVSKERKEVDSNKKHEYSKTIQYDKKKEETASKIKEDKEFKTIENKTKAKESKVNKIEKEIITSLKQCSSIEDKSNSSLASDNGLESDSGKRKKKRKNKKEKRRRKRLSSTESVQCSKKKHSKNKKKNKKKKKEL